MVKNRACTTVLIIALKIKNGEHTPDCSEAYDAPVDCEFMTNKGHYPTVPRQLEEVLYILKEHVENNLFVKYYVRMANFNKVINVLNIKSALSLQWTPMGAAIETSHSMVFAIECVVSIALTADFIFKTFITLLKLAIRT